MVPKSQLEAIARLGGRTLVTICAGFKSNFGVTLCADSQETVGVMKFDAPKLVIRPRVGETSDQVRMLFAGAGDGPFIDKLVDRMWDAALQGPDMKMDEILTRIEDSNIEWHQRIWQLYPPDDRPRAEILFAIHASELQVRLFKATGPIINEVDDYAFVGLGGELGAFLAENFRIPTGGIEDEVGASLFILSNAKKYVDSCGGDSQLAALLLDGSIQELKRWNASVLSEGFEQIASELFYLFATAIDLSESSRSFLQTAKDVAVSISKAREELRKSSSERIKLPSRLGRLKSLYRKIEWPPTINVKAALAPKKSMPSEAQTSEGPQ